MLQTYSGWENMSFVSLIITIVCNVKSELKLYVIIAKLAFLYLTLFFTLLLVRLTLILFAYTSAYTTPLRRNCDHYLLLGKSVYW